MLTIEQLEKENIDFSQLESKKELRVGQFKRLIDRSMSKPVSDSYIKWLAQAIVDKAVLVENHEIIKAAIRTPGVVVPKGVPETDWTEPTRCLYLGESIDERECELCGLRGKKFTVRKCAKYGECSERTRDKKVQDCLTCDEYVPLTNQ